MTDEIKLWVIREFGDRVKALEEREASAARQLKDQAVVYEKKLDELNHAARIREQRDSGFVSLDIFRLYQEKVQDQFNQLGGSSRAGATDMRRTIFEVITLVIAVVLAIRLFIND